MPPPACLRDDACHGLAQPIAWLFCAYALIAIIRDNDERWWLPMGLVIGLAFMAKYTIALWVVALMLGLLLTSARRRLARPSPYIAAVAATLIVLPNLFWQWVHGWPFLEFAAGAFEDKISYMRPGILC